MTMQILREFEKEGMLIKEYTRDGLTVSHRVEEVIVEIDPNYIPTPPQASLSVDEMQMQTLMNTEYLVIMSELTNF